VRTLTNRYLHDLQNPNNCCWSEFSPTLKSPHFFSRYGPIKQAVEDLCFVSGHDFSRAVMLEKMMGFSPCHGRSRKKYKFFPLPAKSGTETT
jgi:hypothetical protein